jgi:hypothetical protein
MVNYTTMALIPAISSLSLAIELLNEFMLEHSIEFYEPMVGEAFIMSILGTDSYEKLNRREKDTIRSINV